MPLLYDYTPDERRILGDVIRLILEQLYPRDKITSLNRDEAYHLCNITSEVIGHVMEYSNLVWSHFNHLNQPAVDPGYEVLLRKVQRALDNRNLDINNLLGSINESNMSKGD